MRAGVFLAITALASAPLAAQDDYEPGFTPEDDLDCALYIGALMAEMDASMTPDNRTGLTSAFTYFIGRYEAQRGLNVGEALAERYLVYRAGNSAQIAQNCTIRMRSFGSRLQFAQSALVEVEREASGGSRGEPDQ